MLAAAQANAPWAFERLYRWLAPAVVGYARGQGIVDADDVLGDVFLRVFRSLAGFTGDETAFRSWVFRIAHNRIVDERRRDTRRGPVVPLVTVQERSGGDVEDQALDVLGRAEVEALLAPLPRQQRDVLLLRLVAGLTVDEVASTLGATQGAVKALQRRGLQAVRAALAKNSVPLGEGSALAEVRCATSPTTSCSSGC